MEDDSLLAQPKGRERGAIAGVETPGIEFVDCPAIRVVIDPRRADRESRDADQQHGRSHYRGERLAPTEFVAKHRADATSPSRALRGIYSPTAADTTGGPARWHCPLGNRCQLVAALFATVTVLLLASFGRAQWETKRAHPHPNRRPATTSVGYGRPNRRGTRQQRARSRWRARPPVPASRGSNPSTA